MSFFLYGYCYCSSSSSRHVYGKALAWQWFRASMLLVAVGCLFLGEFHIIVILLLLLFLL